MDAVKIIELAIQIIGIIGACLAAYVAIKIDLVKMHGKIENNRLAIVDVKNEINVAHTRIDDWYRKVDRSETTGVHRAIG